MTERLQDIVILVNAIALLLTNITIHLMIRRR